MKWEVGIFISDGMELLPECYFKEIRKIDGG